MISRKKYVDYGPAEGSLGQMRASNGEKLGRENLPLITTYPGWVVWQSYFDDHSIRDGFAHIRIRSRVLITGLQNKPEGRGRKVAK